MKRRVLIISLAVLLAVVGTVGVLIYVKKADDRALAGQQAKSVLVAEKRIPAGTTGQVAKADLRVERMPAGSVPSDAVSEVDTELDTLVLSGDVPEGQLLVRTMFVPAAQLTDGIAIPPDKIAVTVPAESWQRVGGLVKAGSKIAVFDSFNVLEGQPGLTPAGDGLQNQHEYNKATRLLLTGLEVLAVRQEKATQSSSSDDAKAANGDIGKALVTVACTQAEAEKLIHAQQTGAIYLALLGDKPAVAPNAGVDNRSAFGTGS